MSSSSITQGKLVLLTRLHRVFKTCCEDKYLQQDLLGHTPFGIYDHGNNFLKVNSFDIQKLSEMLLEHLL